MRLKRVQTLAALALAFSACTDGPTSPSKALYEPGPGSEQQLLAPVLCRTSSHQVPGTGVGQTFAEARNAAFNECKKGPHTNREISLVTGNCSYNLRCTAQQPGASVGPWWGCEGRSPDGRHAIYAGGPTEFDAQAQAMVACTGFLSTYDCQNLPSTLKCTLTIPEQRI